MQRKRDNKRKKRRRKTERGILIATTHSITMLEILSFAPTDCLLMFRAITNTKCGPMTMTQQFWDHGIRMFKSVFETFDIERGVIREVINKYEILWNIITISLLFTDSHLIFKTKKLLFFAFLVLDYRHGFEALSVSRIKAF